MKTAGVKSKIILTWLIAAAMMVAVGYMPSLAGDDADTGQVIFPGQANPRISADIMLAYDLALDRDYASAREICLRLYRDFPNNPAGPTGEMILYQVMMLENEDYNLDKEFRGAAIRAEATSKRFAATAPKNDWYFTILGAASGIKGIYFLRKGEYLNGLIPGMKGFNYMQTAHKMSPHNWEARMAMGVYLYYRSAYSGLLPGSWADQRQKGINEVTEAGKHRKYLNEVSRIALFYIYMNEKDYDRALGYMKGLIKERPEFPAFYQLAGKALMEKGDYKMAYQYYLKMNEIDPELYLPYCKMGECSMNMEKNDEAKKWLIKFFVVLGDQDSVHRKAAEKNLKKLNQSRE